MIFVSTPRKMFCWINKNFVESTKISIDPYLNKKLCCANQIFVDSTKHFSGCVELNSLIISASPLLSFYKLRRSSTHIHTKKKKKILENNIMDTFRVKWCRCDNLKKKHCSFCVILSASGCYFPILKWQLWMHGSNICHV